MESMEIRPLTPADAAAAFAIWNREFPRDRVGPERFAEVFLTPPFYDPDLTPALLEGGTLVGFASVFRDGATAHLRGLVAAGGRADILDRLGQTVAARAQAAGCTALRAVTCHGAPYVYAGIDLRYEPLVRWYQSAGFTSVEEIKDMRVTLGEADAGGKIARLAAKGIAIVDAGPQMLAAMQRFVPTADVDSWFPPGWESGWPEGGRTLVAVECGEILGYADWTVEEGEGIFGPTAVRLDRREQGIGTGLLRLAMQRMRTAGASQATAHWVWPVELYRHNGWSVDRVFGVFEKPLR